VIRINSPERGHRDKLDIIADILKASCGGARKTHLMYHCNLSFRQLESYIKFLISKGLLRMVLIKKSQPVRLYETTDKGQEFLRTYRSLKALIST